MSDDLTDLLSRIRDEEARVVALIGEVIPRIRAEENNLLELLAELRSLRARMEALSTPGSTPNKLAYDIIGWLTRNDTSQRALAAATGVPQATLSRIIHGKGVTADTERRIRAVIDKSPSDRIARWLHDENGPRTLQQIAEACCVADPRQYVDSLVASGAVEVTDAGYEWFGTC